MQYWVVYRALSLLALAVIPGLGVAQAPPPPPLIASLGKCKLEAGGVIPNCRIAYRTFGQLNAERTNAVLIPTWFLGRSEQWIEFLGPTRMIDTTQVYAIVVDALANGNSSSPSNTPVQSRAAFDQLSIADMVEAEHRLVVEHLKLPRLHAVVGISMGGMQAFEWAVRYPDFLDQAISIMGSPRGAPFGALVLSKQLNVIEARLHSIMAQDSVLAEFGRLAQLLLHARVTVEVDGEAGQTLSDLRTATDWMMQQGGGALEDYTAQLHAVLRHDVSARYGGDMAQAAERVRARMLIVYSWEDFLVPAGDAVAFARLVHADTLPLHSPCSHLAPRCEEAVLDPAVREFLAR